MTDAPTTPTAPRRTDIQGLRALAVTAVVADHGFQWPRGGFVGVDVFFVISGFLITGLLLREIDRTGTLSFVDFYRRRVRRIVPASVLVLVVTAVGTWTLLGPARGVVVVRDASAALGFAANWRFAWTGTDYFAAGGPVSPLQHFWSLSVEEQFYFVWPAALALAVLAVGGSRALPRRRRIGAASVLLTLSVASFVWALVESSSSPTIAYFSTFTRAWELGVGAGLAFCAPWLQEHLPDVVRPVVAYAGLGLIVTALATTSSTGGFPAPGALLPCVGTALVIGAGTGGRRRFLWPLTNPVSRYLGDISYSLYLWHFPVLIVLGPVAAYVVGGPQDGWLVGSLLAGVMLVLAVATYHGVERPVLASAWLEPGKLTGLRAYRRDQRRPVVVAGAVSLATVSLVTAALAYDPVPASQPTTDQPTATGTPAAGGAGEGGPGADQAQTDLTARIDAALSATEWPESVTAEIATGAKVDPPGNAAACASAGWRPAAECTFGDAAAPRTALLVGDSIAMAYVPALVDIFGSGEWKLQVAAMYACPFLDLTVGSSAGKAAACAERQAKEYEAVTEVKPDLVIISNTFLRGTDSSTGADATAAAWETATASMLAKVAPAAKHVVVLSPPPFDKDVAECYTTFSGPDACVTKATSNGWFEMATTQQRLVTAVGGTFVDSRPWFCDDQGSCPAFVGDHLVKSDTWHPAGAYVDEIEPAMAAVLLDDAVVGAATEGADGAGASG